MWFIYKHVTKKRKNRLSDNNPLAYSSYPQKLTTVSSQWLLPNSYQSTYSHPIYLGFNPPTHFIRSLTHIIYLPIYQPTPSYYLRLIYLPIHFTTPSSPLVARPGEPKLPRSSPRPPLSQQTSPWCVTETRLERHSPVDYLEWMIRVGE